MSAALRPAPGMIMVQVALLATIVFALVGAGVDYGFLVIENTRIQNAVDASGLAAARSLVSGPDPGVTTSQATATSYLAQYGYSIDANTSITMTFSSSLSNGVMDTITMTVTRNRPMFFWRVIGINQVQVRRSATATANGAMVDVMLSLDLTGSMENSGTDDLPQLRQAVVDFINQMNPSSGDPLGPKVGIARWAGVGCSWFRGNGNRTDNGDIWTPSTGTNKGDGDRYIDLNNASGSGTATWSEYVEPCSDDKTVVTNLTYSKADLVKIADGSGTGTCPTGMGAHACPLTTYDFVAPQVYGTPTTNLGFQRDNSTFGSSPAPGLTGTKLPNAISVVKNTSSGYYAWTTANGARNDTAGEGYARKVLVMMTDGVNEASNLPSTQSTPSDWDSEVVTRATALKLGADGVAGTQDDVEIYVVGFFCTPYSTDTSSTPARWCKSTLADTTAPHPCPGPTWPTASPVPSTIDTILRNASSSSAGTCDHYFPIKKTENLPQLFRVVAGSVARGRLSN